MTESLLPLREACRRLSVSFTALERWIYSGGMRSYRKRRLVQGFKRLLEEAGRNDQGY